MIAGVKFLHSYVRRTITMQIHCSIEHFFSPALSTVSPPHCPIDLETCLKSNTPGKFVLPLHSNSLVCHRPVLDSVLGVRFSDLWLHSLPLCFYDEAIPCIAIPLHVLRLLRCLHSHPTLFVSVCLNWHACHLWLLVHVLDPRIHVLWPC